MDAQQTVDLSREAIMLTLKIGSPILLTGLVVGSIIGLLQAVTQIQEQTLSFVPKLLAMIAALSISLPWLIQQMIDYSRELIQGIPSSIGS